MTEVSLYEPPSTPGIYEQAADAYIEFIDLKHRAPKWNELIDSLFKQNGKDWIDRMTLHGLLRRKEFQDILTQRRHEHVVSTLAPRLLMAHLSSKISTKAAAELLDRLADPIGRGEMETRDLISLVKVCSDLAEKVDIPESPTTEQTAVNKGTIFNLFTQMSPERAAIVAQEIARRQLESERADSSQDNA